MGRNLDPKKRKPFINYVEGFFQQEGRLPTKSEVDGFYNKGDLDRGQQYSNPRVRELLGEIQRVAIVHTGGSTIKAINVFRPKDKEEGGGGIERNRG